MDFFEAQSRAKKRSGRLVLLFVLAVLGTIGATYVAVALILSQVGAGDPNSFEGGRLEIAWWNPQLFAGVAVATLSVVGLGSLFKWSQFSAGGSAVAESVGGRRVDPQTRDLRERRLVNVVEEMAIASGVPVPAVYVLDQEPAINAFAAGLTTNDAAVAVTRGTLEKLNRDELQGVIGHEFSHILNGDMRLNLRLAALLFGILVLGIIGRGILWSMRGSRSRSGKNGGNGGVVIGIGLALVIIGYIGFFFGRLIQAAVSRQREFLADAAAVQFTRNPGGIAGALKKIGGFALGSSMQSNESAAIGHFFFSQAFKTGVTGLWATHPPLEERIRAIDSNFDGKFFEPPELVDVERESFVSAGLASPQHPLLRSRGQPAPAAHGDQTVGSPAVPPVLAPGLALVALATSGVLTPDQIGNAQALLASTPPRLREAAHTPAEARALLWALLLDDTPEGRSRQRALLVEREGHSAVEILRQLEPALLEVRDEHRLPLVQLALPTLRQLSHEEIHHLLGSLEALVRSDSRVTAFEFAVRRIVGHALAVGERPSLTVVQYHSFHGVVDDIAAVLSVLAAASTAGAEAAASAFSMGAAQLRLIEGKLRYDGTLAQNFAAFDAALDKLGHASLPIKQRTLIASAHVVQADGQVRVAEFELLRAVAAALDVPMPALAG